MATASQLADLRAQQDALYLQYKAAMDRGDKSAASKVLPKLQSAQSAFQSAQSSSSGTSEFSNVSHTKQQMDAAWQIYQSNKSSANYYQVVAWQNAYNRAQQEAASAPPPATTTTTQPVQGKRQPGLQGVINHPKRNDPVQSGGGSSGGGGGGGSADPFDKDGNGVPDYIDAQNEANRRNAFALLSGQFKQYGITDEGFFTYIMELLVQGYDASTISLLLQDHAVYKERFKGNEQRRARGLAVLSPAEYLATEGAYAQVLRAAGLPVGFYDDPKTDFADWIGKDVSPSEVKERADMAQQQVNRSDPSSRQALAEYYGITDSMLAAYFLDNNRALPLLRKQVEAAEIGAAAKQFGLSATSRDRAERFAEDGVDGQEARQAYGEIAGFLKPQQAIGNRFHDPYSQADAEDEILGGMASARRKRERLNRNERALFRGSSGIDRSSLRTATAGSY